MRKSKQRIEIEIPGSKSITNRVLVLAALSEHDLIIENFAPCDDSFFMLENLQKLGINIEQKNSTLLVKGKSVKKSSNNKEIEQNKSNNKIKLYTGNAGTTTRFLTSLCTILAAENNQTIVIDGDERMRERPIHALTKVLNSIGAKIETSKTGCPPITVFPEKITKNKIEIPGEISSQYISSLLLIGWKLENGLEINIKGDLCSKPYVQITLDILDSFGIKVQNKKFEQFTISGGQKIKKIKKYIVEPDASSASYISAFRALERINRSNSHKEIMIKNLDRNSIQGDIKFLDYLDSFENKKLPDEIDMNATPDLVMTLAILAIFKEGKTKITNIENLRIKETDRIQALENELSKLGINVKSGSDFLEIEGVGNLKNFYQRVNQKLLENLKTKDLLQVPTIKINTYNDHRMAMCFGILLDILPILEIENPNCVSKSYRSFWQDLEKIKNGKNIILTGLRGSGKSTIGKLMAKKLGREFIDLDDKIENDNQKTISAMVEENGWEYFRENEKIATKEVSKNKNKIIATGGGTIIDPENAENLKENGLIIYLDVSPTICATRISNDQKNQNQRPKITEEKNILSEIKKLHQEREKVYKVTADLILKN